MRTVFSHPLLPSLSLVLFFFLTPLHCRLASGVRQGTSGSVAEWLAGWEAVASMAQAG